MADRWRIGNGGSGHRCSLCERKCCSWDAWTSPEAVPRHVHLMSSAFVELVVFSMLPPCCRSSSMLFAVFCAEEVVEYCEGAYLEPGANKRDVSLVESPVLSTREESPWLTLLAELGFLHFFQ